MIDYVLIVEPFDFDDDVRILSGTKWEIEIYKKRLTISDVLLYWQLS
jgi:hypothetical protein